MDRINARLEDFSLLNQVRMLCFPKTLLLATLFATTGTAQNTVGDCSPIVVSSDNVQISCQVVGEVKLPKFSAALTRNTVNDLNEFVWMQTEGGGLFFLDIFIPDSFVQVGSDYLENRIGVDNLERKNEWLSHTDIVFSIKLSIEGDLSTSLNITDPTTIIWNEGRYIVRGYFYLEPLNNMNQGWTDTTLVSVDRSSVLLNRMN